MFHDEKSTSYTADGWGFHEEEEGLRHFYLFGGHFHKPLSFWTFTPMKFSSAEGFGGNIFLEWISLPILHPVV